MSYFHYRVLFEVVGTVEAQDADEAREQAAKVAEDSFDNPVACTIADVDVRIIPPPKVAA